MMTKSSCAEFLAYSSGRAAARLFHAHAFCLCFTSLTYPLQANLETWSPILDHIDSLIGKELRDHPEVTLCGKVDDDGKKSDPVATVPVTDEPTLVQSSLRLFLLLRFSLLLLENARCKTAYSSMEVRDGTVVGCCRDWHSFTATMLCVVQHLSQLLGSRLDLLAEMALRVLDELTRPMSTFHPEEEAVVPSMSGTPSHLLSLFRSLPLGKQSMGSGRSSMLAYCFDAATKLPPVCNALSFKFTPPPTTLGSVTTRRPATRISIANMTEFAAGRPAWKVLDQLVSEHDVPTDEHVALLWNVRALLALSSPILRQRAVSCRLAASRMLLEDADMFEGALATEFRMLDRDTFVADLVDVVVEAPSQGLGPTSPPRRLSFPNATTFSPTSWTGLWNVDTLDQECPLPVLPTVRILALRCLDAVVAGYNSEPTSHLTVQVNALREALGLIRYSQYEHSLVMSLLRQAVEHIKTCPAPQEFLPLEVRDDPCDPGGMCGIAFVQGIHSSLDDGASEHDGSPSDSFTWGHRVLPQFFEPPQLQDASAVITLGMSLLAISSTWARSMVQALLPLVEFHTPHHVISVAVTRGVLALYGAVAGANSGGRLFHASNGPNIFAKRIEEECAKQLEAIQSLSQLEGVDYNSWATEMCPADHAFGPFDNGLPVELPQLVEHRAYLVSLLLDTLAGAGLGGAATASIGSDLLRSAAASDDSDHEDVAMEDASATQDAEQSATTDSATTSTTTGAQPSSNAEDNSSEEPDLLAPEMCRPTPDNSPLARALKTMFRFPEAFEPALVGNAATLLADIVNADPSCCSSVHRAGRLLW